MCIIIAKKAGVAFPSKEILQNCWDVNSDGAGYMYSNNGQVEIRKGFMQIEQLLDSLNSIPNKDDIPMIIHFRIKTHGETNKAQTHPFPVSSSEKMLRSTRVRTDLGVAHNGIINIDNDRGLSDTMQFVKDELSLFNAIKPSWYKDIKALDYIGNRIDSKLAVMDRKGYIALVGKFYEEDGIFYSNQSYQGYIHYYGNYSNWGSTGNYTYSWTIHEEELISRMVAVGMYGYEAEGIMWELDTRDIEKILDKDSDPYTTLINRFYGTNVKR